MVEEASNACGIATLKRPGFEADDLIATYCTLAEREDTRVTIVTPDKDMMQLISPRVRCFDPAKRMLFDEAAVVERWGVVPSQVVFVQALTGDKVDNIPGAPGIGPKIAAKLVSEYGSIDGIRANMEKLPKKIQESQIRVVCLFFLLMVRCRKS